jgi:lipoprotein-anchoring transpeptidase ErfK/SrfK
MFVEVLECSMYKIVAAALISASIFFGLQTQSMAGGLTAHVDISSQTMTVTNYGQTYVWRVSTAGNGYSTPRGTFKPQRLARMHYSKKYHNSPMPFSVFFRGGFAIHGTNAIKRLGSPASHGCVRLHPSNAASLYSMIRQAGAKNTRIIITQ